MLRPDVSSTSSVNAVFASLASYDKSFCAAALAAAERGRPENAQHWPQSGADCCWLPDV